ncbi:MAG TPA: tRNA uridine-5-carboxymethylaminomethyl(34) synthesis GTPase MnmE [Chloroflexota bacterium]|nr:tRNA uridine-5-carboxymethylaminomethyl(34) synthesis GTPase MnmE [Chloroflexota bacterium]
MLGSNDTIAAVATPPGQGGVGIVRLSGPQARAIGERIFTPSRRGAGRQSHRLVHGILRDPASGAMLDQGLCCWMGAPRSYTGEDVVEFHCHGSPMVLEQVLSCCVREGARLANRGEFTLRAFLNGQMDLAQAEAVMDLVRARTATAAQVAARGLTGALALRLAPLEDSVTGTLAYLEATIDFVEEDLPEQAAPDLAETVAQARRELEEILRRAAHGAILRDGVRVVLAGKPNVGKSSLLNALLRRDRAIVTEIPGTTRDTLEEAVDIHGLPIFLVDTAGLAETDDPVERLGIARSATALREAGIIALVVDAGAPPDASDRAAVAAIHQHAPRVPLVLVLNKCDLPTRSPAACFTALLGSGESGADGQTIGVVECAAATGQGLDALEDALAAIALGGEQLDAENTLIERSRQRQALQDTVQALATAEQGLRQGRPSELVCIDLSTALEALGTVTGRNVSEAVLDRIFHDFCIGK